MFSRTEKAHSQAQNNDSYVLLILDFMWLFGSLRPCKIANLINGFELELAGRKNAFYLGHGAPHALVIKTGRKQSTIHPINLHGVSFKRGPDGRLTPLCQTLH